ncbi:hypothetical protein OCU04_010878 [Sclerotinia nivalis]|uniref:Uncharacterized protein n=1 Tax=Sclerotinia nivalis TaxID=352851 RepID=A0A9X0AE84_9HELO|nr:hypothetical protein OCU04_010878 [Sclerotinia nivalis]
MGSLEIRIQCEFASSIGDKLSGIGMELSQSAEDGKSDDALAVRTLCNHGLGLNVTPAVTPKTHESLLISAQCELK